MTKRCETCHFRPCRCDDLASRRPPAVYGKATWPMKSQAMAVHPEQIQEAMERNKRHGVVGVSYERDGTAVLSDVSAKRALMKLEGFQDKNAGYGDTYNGSSPQPELPAEDGADEFTDEGPQKEVQERAR